jgi:hypothetical protein
MANTPHEQPPAERRTPVNDDLDPDGMDSESEADELEAAGSDARDADTEEADGTRDRNTDPDAR